MYIYLSTWVHLDFCPLVLGSTAGLRNNWRTSRNSRIVITQYLDYLSKLWDTQLHEITNWYILQKRADGHKLKTGFPLTLKFDLRMLCEKGGTSPNIKFVHLFANQCPSVRLKKQCETCNLWDNWSEWWETYQFRSSWNSMRQNSKLCTKT